ncbi:MAG: YceI family protein [Bacteroidia bacterium]
MTTWKIDPAHSHVEFKVKHLVISSAKGEFTKYDATVESSKDDFTDAKITFEADVDSISTGNPQRDGHLKSDDFFNAASFPKLKFVSKEIKKISGENYKLTGDLTIRDKSLPVTLDVVFGGISTVTLQVGRRTVAGFEIHGKINRQDYGLKWSATTEAGGLVVSDEVKIEITAEIIKQA